MITCHGSDVTLAQTNPWLRPFVKKALSRADAVVAVSDHIRRYTVDVGARDAEVIYLGVDPDVFHPPRGPEEAP